MRPYPRHLRRCRRSAATSRFSCPGSVAEQWYFTCTVHRPRYILRFCAAEADRGRLHLQGEPHAEPGCIVHTAGRLGPVSGVRLRIHIPDATSHKHDQYNAALARQRQHRLHIRVQERIQLQRAGAPLQLPLRCIRSCRIPGQHDLYIPYRKRVTDQGRQVPRPLHSRHVDSGVRFCPTTQACNATFA